MSHTETATLSTEVYVHPLVLLSVTDHFNRYNQNVNSSRVVGVLLGTRTYIGNVLRVDATNAFAVPFEEDKKKPKVWFLDHNFLEEMYWMFKKVNTRENIVGFYSTGPKIKENDLKISSLFKKFCNFEPAFVIIDVSPNKIGIPTTAYQATEEVETEGKDIQRVFKHIPCCIEAEEAEEVGVEHLLRDINDPSTSTLALQIKQKVNGLAGLLGRLSEIHTYLKKIVEGKVPINNQIVYNLQNIFNLIPNLNVEELVRSILVKTNDMYLVIYLSALIRSILALHGLLNNKLKYKDIDEVMDRDAGIDVANKNASSEDKDNEKKTEQMDVSE